MKTLHEFTEEEKLKAQNLAEELCDKLEEYFPKECSNEEIEEVKKLKRELEEMGFLVTWKGSLGVPTYQFKVSVTLWVPKHIH